MSLFSSIGNGLKKAATAVKSFVSGVAQRNADALSAQSAAQLSASKNVNKAVSSAVSTAKSVGSAIAPAVKSAVDTAKSYVVSPSSAAAAAAPASSSAVSAGYNPSSASAPEPPTPQPVVYQDAPLASSYGMDKSVAYQEALASTAHQREVKDLVAAGLNPVLGYSGSGAATFAAQQPASDAGSPSGGNVNSGKGLVYYVTELFTKSKTAAEAAQGLTDTFVSMFSKK